MIVIREIQESDAEAFLALCRQLDLETTFMMLEPDERLTTPEGQRGIINDIVASPNSTILLADTGAGLAGYVAAHGGEFRRVRHSVYVIAGVRQAFAGQGIGTRLFGALHEWAQTCSVHRLELTVMAHNEAAIGLYRKMGYDVEGVKRDSLLVDGRYVDELYMAKLLE